MYTDEEYQKLRRTAARLQADLDRETAYTRKVNDKNAQLMEEIKDLKQQLSKTRQETKRRIHNERGAGRKRIASAEVAALVLELSAQGLSQTKIAVKISDEFNFRIGRSTVGEIVRGKYAPRE
jgi:uncharacterized protein YlxW (UPF0749 family)